MIVLLQEVWEIAVILFYLWKVLMRPEAYDDQTMSFIPWSINWQHRQEFQGFAPNIMLSSSLSGSIK